ncbi:MAG: DMT family transporter [Alphaproteobacteria bacterium]|nr:DMT family transporter [Alphaproteobacteria bacterium]
MTPTRDPLYAQGVALTLFISLMWSTSPLIFRHIEGASPWQVIFFRAMSLVIALTIVLAFRYRASFFVKVRAIGRPGLLASACLGSGSVLYIFALDHTTVANVAFLTSSVPFITAILGWLVLREAVAGRTWACIGLALAGVGVMVAEGFALGGWVGNLLALGCATVSAVQAVCLRHGRGVDMWPSVLLAGVVAMSIAAPFVDDFGITWRNLALCALQGVFISAFCNILFTICARRVPVAELTLLSLAESILSPFWVWLLLAEVPSEVTLIGGAIVLLAVVVQAMAALRAAHRSPA